MVVAQQATAAPEPFVPFYRSAEPEPFIPYYRSAESVLRKVREAKPDPYLAYRSAEPEPFIPYYRSAEPEPFLPYRSAKPEFLEFRSAESQYRKTREADPESSISFHRSVEREPYVYYRSAEPEPLPFIPYHLRTTRELAEPLPIKRETRQATASATAAGNGLAAATSYTGNVATVGGGNQGGTVIG